MRRLLIALLLAASACAPQVGEAFLLAKARGDRARSAGRYEEAARAYREAADAAQRRRDRDEALFLEAGIHQRSGDLARAAEAYRLLRAESPDGERAPRAAFELAWMTIDQGEIESGHALLEEALFAHPRSGPARRSLVRHLEYLADKDGPRAAVAFADRALPRLADSDLGERLLFERAKHLEAAGDLQAARDGFVACAERYPYPFGSLFDDSLFRASLIDEELGRYELAIASLEEMLRHREPSTFNGSYERPLFPRAQMRIAEIYRDRLFDNAAARRAFHKLYAEHETSLLRDDALWEEAVLARNDGDSREACARVALLVETMPDSRYAPCSRLLCEAAPLPQGTNECRPYIQRTYGRR